MSVPKREFRYLELLISIFIVVLLISNLVAQKICAFRQPARQRGPTAVPDHLHLRRRIYRGVWLWRLKARDLDRLLRLGLDGRAGSDHCRPAGAAPEWPNQAAFATVFGFVPRIVVSSLIAFWCGEFANSYTLAKMKLITKGKHLWTRTVGSTVVGQAVDTALVIVLAFDGTLPVKSLVTLIVSGYVSKVIYEVAMTPLTYAVVNFLKRREGVDTFDYNTDFNPFAATAAKPITEQTAPSLPAN